jgi:nucleoside-diphosphate-sugar epimerase
MKYYRNKKVLITGGAGFIGSNLAKALVRLKADVSIVDSMIPDYGGNLFNLRGIEDKVKINYSDIRDQRSLNYIVQGKELIFSLAGQVSHIDSMKDPFTDLDINCKTHLSLLEACKKYNPDVKMVFTSTRQVYGKPLYLPVDEKHLLQPRDVNGINNMAAEWYYILYNQVYGIKAVILRLTNTYGPGQLMKHDRQGFTGVFIRKAICGEEIKIFGTGRQLRDFNYVEDVVNALLISGLEEKAYGKIYNLGHAKYYSLLDFVKILKKYCEFKYKIVPFSEDRKRIDIGDYYADFSKIHEELGWNPETGLEEGLRKTVAYYKKYKRYYW